MGNITAYIILIVAVVLGTASNGFAKGAQGFTLLIPSILTAITIVGCMYTLSLVMKSIPVGITYASFAGLTIIATVVVGIMCLNKKNNITNDNLETFSNLNNMEYTKLSETLISPVCVIEPVIVLLDNINVLSSMMILLDVTSLNWTFEPEPTACPIEKTTPVWSVTYSSILFWSIVNPVPSLNVIGWFRLKFGT